MSHHQPPHTGYGPPPPKKNGPGKMIGIGCAGILGLFLIIGIFSAALDDSSDTNKHSTVKERLMSHSPTTEDPTEATPPKTEAPKKEEKPKVVFKVWGEAPAGALGPLDINYGSDSDTRKGTFKNGTFEATLPLNEDALYYTVTAQLQGSGDINCSVTVDGKTKEAHASGDYQICHAQSNNLLGSWD